MRNMQNPFKYGSVVGKESFCNRRRELSDISRAMENGDKLFIYSERRLGKTSLAKLALERLPRTQYVAAYVDLWPTDGEASFAAAVAKGISKSMATTADKLLDVAGTFFGRLAPSITLDDQGKPQVTFGLSRAADSEIELDELLSAPGRIAQQGKKKVVVVLDEFQQIAEYGNDRVERSLRSAVQTQEAVSYLFLGSRKHLIQKMFLDKSRPLYRAGGHYPLGMIAEEHWLPFIHEKFRDADRHIGEELIRSLCRLTEGHPFYTQHLCHALWELSDTNSTVTEERLGAAVQMLLERESYTYAILWESLSINQQRLLRGLGDAPEEVKPFSAKFVRTHRLGSPSNAQRALKALIERDIVDRDNGSLLISDRFFRIWIQSRQNNERT
jgi:uncharacterized protein